jgi:hypothetical protein
MQKFKSMVGKLSQTPNPPNTPNTQQPREQRIRNMKKQDELEREMRDPKAAVLKEYSRVGIVSQEQLLTDFGNRHQMKSPELRKKSKRYLENYLIWLRFGPEVAAKAIEGINKERAEEIRNFKSEK